jgi:hypothetical protein
MATATLEIPPGSGNKVRVNVDAYNKLSQAERSQFYDQEFNAYKQRERENLSSPDRLEDIDSTLGEKAIGTTRATLGQGLLFGFGDELEAGLRTGFGLAGDYGKTVADIRDDMAQFRKSDPLLAYGGEIAGAFVPALLTGGAGAVATAGRLGVGQLAKEGAKQGAKYGGAYGLGTAESEQGASAYDIAMDRAKGLAYGVGIGGATGGVLNPAIGKSMEGGRALKRYLDKIGDKGNAVEDSANRTIANYLSKESADDITRVVDDNVNPTMLADVGENARGLAYATQQTVNPSRTQVADDLMSRNNEQSSRILETIKNTTGIGDDKIGLKFIEKLDERVQELASPVYKEAYQVSIPANKFRDLLTSPSKKVLTQASKEGQELLAIDGVSVPNLAQMYKTNTKTGFGSFDDIMAQEFDTGFLHATKRGLDKMIDKETDKLTGQMSPKGVALTKLKNKWNDIIKENNPAYAKANKEFADTQKLREAFELGGKYKTTTIRKIKQDLEKMTPAEREAWKSGMITKLEDVAQSRRDSTNFLNEIDGSNKLNEIVDILITDPTQKKAFSNILKAEKDMSETFGLLRQNSNTNTKTLASKEFAESDKLIDKQGLFATLVNMTEKGVQKAKGVVEGQTTSKRAELIAQRLFTTDKATQRKVLDQLKITNKELAEEVQKRLKKATDITTSLTRPLTSIEEGKRQVSGE